MERISNEELVQAAGSTVIGTPSGLKAQQAQAELNRRLIESMDQLRGSIDKNNDATKKYNKVILNLTLAMALLAVFQVLLAAFTTIFPWPIKIGLAIVPIMIIVMVLRDK